VQNKAKVKLDKGGDQEGRVRSTVGETDRVSKNVQNKANDKMGKEANLERSAV
jgi:hypothetical protein